MKKRGSSLSNLAGRNRTLAIKAIDLLTDSEVPALCWKPLFAKCPRPPPFLHRVLKHIRRYRLGANKLGKLLVELHDRLPYLLQLDLVLPASSLIKLCEQPISLPIVKLLHLDFGQNAAPARLLAKRLIAEAQ